MYMLSQRHERKERDMDGGHTDTCKCYRAHLQALQQLGFCCGRRQFARPHYAHHLEEILKDNCVQLSFNCYRPLAKFAHWIRGAPQVLCHSCHFSETGNWSPSTGWGGHDWKRGMNQVEWSTRRCDSLRPSFRRQKQQRGGLAMSD